MIDSAMLQDYCKLLHISNVFSVYDEKYTNNFEVTKFLIEALSAEWETRRVNRQMKALKSAGFPTSKRFEDIQIEALPGDGQTYLSKLQSLTFMTDRKNVILIGNSGTGKTHCAIATGIAACMNDFKVLFRTAAMLVNELHEAKRLGRLASLIKQIKRVDLLIIDELGYISFDLESAELLFQLLATRYETQSTLISPFAHIRHKFPELLRTQQKPLLKDSKDPKSPYVYPQIQ